MTTNGQTRDTTWNLEPQPPEWAIQAGLPAPAVGEVMGDYCTRIGVGYYTLIADLDDRAAVNIHIRFANRIAEICPDAWRAHVTEWVNAHRR